MAKFPTYEEMGKKVAEKALDEFLYDGKSIREWMQIIASEDAISREVAIDTIESWLSCDDYNEAERHIMRAMQSVLYDLPPVNPQKPKSECEHDHEILKAHSDGANEVLAIIRAEIDEEYDRVHPYDISCAEGLEMALNIVDKYMAEGSGEE